MPEKSKHRRADEQSGAGDARKQAPPQGPTQVGKPIGAMRRVTKAVGDSRKKAEAAFESK